MNPKTTAGVVAAGAVAAAVITGVVMLQTPGMGPPRPMYTMPSQTNSTEQVIAFKKYRRIVVPRGKTKAQQDAFWQNYLNMQKEGGLYTPPPSQ